jgi:hypothetical protein
MGDELDDQVMISVRDICSFTSHLVSGHRPQLPLKPLDPSARDKAVGA